MSCCRTECGRLAELLVSGGFAGNTTTVLLMMCAECAKRLQTASPVPILQRPIPERHRT